MGFEIGKRKWQNEEVAMETWHSAAMTTGSSGRSPVKECGNVIQLALIKFSYVFPPGKESALCLCKDRCETFSFCLGHLT